MGTDIATSSYGAIMRKHGKELIHGRKYYCKR